MTTNRLTILVVDDAPPMRRLLARWLETAGYRVEQAGSGAEALASIEASCPEMLIVDWNMPGMDGVELCRRVRQLRLPHYVYTVFLTARCGAEQVIQGLDAGADGFLTKPIHREELLARVRAGQRMLVVEQRLAQAARTDELTGLRTRRSFHDLFEKEWDRSSRMRIPVSCAMVDIDFFKRINDNHGHQFGDQIIELIGKTLEATCRGSDTLSRYGGEEFCVLLPETAEHEAAVWAERARAEIAALRIPAGDDCLRVTCSFGIAQRSDETVRPAELIDRADQALMCSKQSGRDRVVCFNSMCEAGRSRLKDASQTGDLLAGAIARDVMTPLIACLRTDQTIGSAADFFLRSRINSTPVVDAAGQLAGMISEKDLLAAMVSLDAWREPIRKVMKPNVLAYSEDTPIRRIYEFLCRVTIRRVVIVRDGRPCGTISVLRAAPLVPQPGRVIRPGRQCLGIPLRRRRGSRCADAPGEHRPRTARQASAIERAIGDRHSPISACAPGPPHGCRSLPPTCSPTRATTMNCRTAPACCNSGSSKEKSAG